MNENTHQSLPNATEIPDISEIWGLPLQAAHCPRCREAHLIPAEMQTALCPACYGANLELQPTINRPEAPELLIKFNITPQQVKTGLQNWLKGVWLRPHELQANLLTQRLTRTFIPMWLVDGVVSGTWQAEMGYDYQVASSQEVYRNGSWTTRKLTETRIRWEPRVGTVQRNYQNLGVPALEEHLALNRGLGQFALEHAAPYSSEWVNNASIRVPSLLPEAAWPNAQSGFDRLSANDCQRAADAQHVDEYQIQAAYDQQNWTQMLLPVYTTAYRDEEGKVHPILIHGQSGKIFGLKRASQKIARNWSLGLAALAFVCFVLGLLFAAATVLLPLLGAVSLLFFGGALVVGLIAPIPAIWAWNFNRDKD